MPVAVPVPVAVAVALPVAVSLILRISAFVTGTKKRRKMVLFNPHLTFDPEDYIGHAIHFWKEELPNILKTCPVPDVVFRLRHCSGVKKCFVL